MDMQGTTFLQIKQFDPLQAGQNYQGFNSGLLLSLSAMRNSSGMSGDREQVRRGNGTVAGPGRSEEIRTQEDRRS